MYRKKDIPVSYNDQGYIYFLSKRYRRLPPADREKIRRICREAGGDHHAALLEWVTTDHSRVQICQTHYIDEKTMKKLARKYFEIFAESI